MYLKLFVIPIFFIAIINGKNISDCKYAAKSIKSCNPYGTQFIKSKEALLGISTEEDDKSLEIISVADMLGDNRVIEKSLRFGAEHEYIKNIFTNQEDILDNNFTIKKVQEKSIFNKKIYNTESGVYKVVSGDVLTIIAQKFGLKVKILLNLNRLNKKSTLKIGQEIKIPLSQVMVNSIASGKYKIVRGDTLLSIAYRFKLDPKKLVSFNHLKSTTMIREGKMLSLPLPHILKTIEIKEEKERARKKALAKKEALAKAKKKALAKTNKLKRIKSKIKNKKIGKNKLRVTATAYSSHKKQTDNTPFLAAWNNRIRPGMKIIAVSRDLLTRYGLRNGSKVRIGGLRGYYVVRDKMNKRYKKRIDIYMGMNRRRALRWGRRSVMLYW